MEFTMKWKIIIHIHVVKVLTCRTGITSIINQLFLSLYQDLKSSTYKKQWIMCSRQQWKLPCKSKRILVKENSLKKYSAKPQLRRRVLKKIMQNHRVSRDIKGIPYALFLQNLNWIPKEHFHCYSIVLSKLNKKV